MSIRPATAPTERRTVLGCAGLLVLAGVAAYHNSLGGPFVFDDGPAIVDNPTIRQLADLPTVLGADSGPGVTTSGRPLVNLSLALCYAVSGQAVWSYHVFNLAVHVLAGLTLFGVVRRTLAGGPGAVVAAGVPADVRRAATPLALASALLWLVHPLQTESVTYVVQRAESMMGLCVLFACYAFLRATTAAQPRGWQVATVAAGLAGVACKEVAAVLPVLLVLYDRTFVAGSWREVWQRRRGLHAAVAASWLVQAGLLAGTGWNRGGTVGFDLGVGLVGHWLTQVVAAGHYLRLIVWPHPLSFEYGSFTVSVVEAAPSALVVLPLMAGTILALRRWPAIGFLGAWFFVLLAPTSLVPGAMQVIVEHRLYLPLAAPFVGGVVGLWHWGGWLAGAATGDQAVRARIFRFIWASVVLVVAGVLGGLTVRRNALYADPLALWEQTVAVSPASAKAHSSLGALLYERHRMGEAMFHYRISLGLDPGRVATHYNLAVACTATGHPAAAEAHSRAALRLNPGHAGARAQRGLALLALNRLDEALPELAEAARLAPERPENHYTLGMALARRGRLADALDPYREALGLRPDFTAADNDLGVALYQLNRPAEALACFRRVATARPGVAEAHFNLGVALGRVGELDGAATAYAEAVRLDPSHAGAQFNLGLAWMRLGRDEAALEPLRRAAALRPTAAEAHGQLGLACLRTGRAAEAVGALERAQQLQPGNAGTHYQLGCALAETGRLAEGRRELEAALALDPQFTPAREALRRLAEAGR